MDPPEHTSVVPKWVVTTATDVIVEEWVVRPSTCLTNRSKRFVGAPVDTPTNLVNQFIAES